MTDLDRTPTQPTAKQPFNKRDRLVFAARELIHSQGIERTTLADVADASGVPLGNVYYYFKTKNELVEAVVNSRTQELTDLLDALDALPSPVDRLKGMIQAAEAKVDEIVESGCPMGTLCTELEKRDDGLAKGAATMMRRHIDWVETQFRLLGREDAAELAVAFVAAYQGVAVLTNALRDPHLLIRESRRIQRWVESLA
jgi:AcrR family transcriptional regulator